MKLSKNEEFMNDEHRNIIVRKNITMQKEVHVAVTRNNYFRVSCIVVKLKDHENV